IYKQYAVSFYRFGGYIEIPPDINNNIQLQMKALISHLKPTSLYLTRFISSLVSLQTYFFDPFHFLNESRKYTLQEAKIIHTHLLKSNFLHTHVDVSNHLLRIYCKASAFDYALKVFDQMPQPDITSWNLLITSHNQTSIFDDALRVFNDESCGNVVCWNAIISGAIKLNKDDVGLSLFRRMCRGFPSPNRFTFPSVIGACAKLQEFELGRVVHGLVVKYGEQEDMVVGTAIVDFYAKCGQVNEAIKMFSRMPTRNVVSWTAIITGFVQKGEVQSALELFKQMMALNQEINTYTVTSVLSACANPLLCKQGFQIHCWIYKTGLYSDPTVKNCLINLYSKIGAIELSEQVFEDMNNLMNPMGCSLFTMYSKCGCLNESYEIFSQIPDKDNVSWASMISGFTEHGYAYRAIELFREMLLVKNVTLDETTLTALLAACSSLRVLKTGKEIHGFFIRQQDKKSVFGGSSMVNMYSRCGDLKSAKRVFNLMPFKDQTSCSSLVSGYAQNGCVKETLDLFVELLSSGLEVDSFTVSSVLAAVGDLNHSDVGIGVKIGTQLHASIVKLGFESKASVGSSLVMMYSKYGNLDDCLKGFNQIKEPDVISWTAMINSYANHGNGLEALRVFELMKKSGTEPDSVTFVAVLTACSHSGLVKEGYSYLKSMVKDYGIEPSQRHYACMVDVLGRSGRLQEAEQFIRNMPVEPGSLVWGTLLAACKVHADVEIGKIAAEKFIELEPSSDGGYVAFSNICADVGQWEEVLKIRNEMKGTGIKKQPGWRNDCEITGVGGGIDKGREPMVSQIHLQNLKMEMLANVDLTAIKTAKSGCCFEVLGFA
ncbi:hypothetical protein M8C21_002917, partial [Ambrosia artemisiifolia]